MPDPMINANPSAWWKVQRDQCRANVMACVSCGMALGLAHHPLCYTAALAPVDSGSSAAPITNRDSRTDDSKGRP